jgi:hypothetical protein
MAGVELELGAAYQPLKTLWMLAIVKHILKIDVAYYFM